MGYLRFGIVRGVFETAFAVLLMAGLGGILWSAADLVASLANAQPVTTLGVLGPWPVAVASEVDEPLGRR